MVRLRQRFHGAVHGRSITTGCGDLYDGAGEIPSAKWGRAIHFGCDQLYASSDAPVGLQSNQSTITELTIDGQVKLTSTPPHMTSTFGSAYQDPPPPPIRRAGCGKCVAGVLDHVIGWMALYDREDCIPRQITIAEDAIKAAPESDVSWYVGIGAVTGNSSQSPLRLRAKSRMCQRPVGIIHEDGIHGAPPWARRRRTSICRPGLLRTMCYPDAPYRPSPIECAARQCTYSSLRG